MDFTVETLNQSHHKQVIQLLMEISKFKPSPTSLETIWLNFSKQGNHFSRVFVSDNKVLGYGALLIEYKIRGGKVGHIEDIVSHESHRKIGIGKTILSALMEIAKNEGCYKVTLHCQNHNVPFYEKCGFIKNGSSMQLVFNQ